jgi:hypothetical protein
LLPASPYTSVLPIHKRALYQMYLRLSMLIPNNINNG